MALEALGHHGRQGLDEKSVFDKVCLLDLSLACLQSRQPCSQSRQLCSVCSPEKSVLDKACLPHLSCLLIAESSTLFAELSIVLCLYVESSTLLSPFACQELDEKSVLDEVLLPTSDTPHPTPYTRHPTPCTLHPTPCTLHPTPDTRHPAPYTLHPTPHTPHQH